MQRPYDNINVDNSELDHLHIHRVPIDYLFLEMTVITCKTWSTGPESEYRILNNWLAISYTFEEVCQMLKMFIISFRSGVLCSRFYRSCLICFGILLVVTFHEFFLHSLGIGIKCVPSAYTRSF